MAEITVKMLKRSFRIENLEDCQQYLGIKSCFDCPMCEVNKALDKSCADVSRMIIDNKIEIAIIDNKLFQIVED